MGLVVGTLGSTPLLSPQAGKRSVLKVVYQQLVALPRLVEPLLLATRPMQEQHIRVGRAVQRLPAIQAAAAVAGPQAQGGMVALAARVVVKPIQFRAAAVAVLVQVLLEQMEQPVAPVHRRQRRPPVEMVGVIPSQRGAGLVGPASVGLVRAAVAALAAQVVHPGLVLLPGLARHTPNGRPRLEARLDLPVVVAAAVAMSPSRAVATVATDKCMEPAAVVERSVVRPVVAVEWVHKALL